jgi:DNA processing protein
VREWWVALSLSRRPLEIQPLLERHGSVEMIFERNLQLPGMPSPIRDLRDRARSVLEACEKHGIVTVSYGDAEYPAVLRTLKHPPPVLYTAGRVGLLRRPAVAVVGSRRCSSYGRWAARTLARGLSRRGICVVSGMAFGIDAAAHEGALEGDGGTVAVLGGGPERSSPASLGHLYSRLREDQLVLSEFAPGTQPRPEFFPRRNRIVAGLSRGVVVVEAARRSGALITAHLALETGKDVFAVPGPIDSPSSAGTNQLIRDGAAPVLGDRDVAETLGLTGLEGSSESDPGGPILDALAASDADLGQLQRRTGLPLTQLRGMLLRLRLHGAVRCLGGDRYQRVE